MTSMIGSYVPERGEITSRPTDHDDFSERAQTDYADLPEDAKRNREALKKAMTDAGFTTIRTKWWHFNDIDKEKYDLLDLPLLSPE